MTRRSSPRALAQEIYREAVENDAPSLTLPRKRGREEEALQGGGEPSLTARVRALYEGSAVPVREIAKLAGVSERTIYKYAAKHDWKPRYAWTADGSRPRRWRAAEEFAPVKGGGGRFLRRADRGRPFAVGLKATDAQGAARAHAACARAAAIAAEAEAEAAAVRRLEQRVSAMAAVKRAAAELARHRAQRAKHPPRKPAARRAERALRLLLEVALRQWELLAAAP
jgi:hypothetical protein